MPPASVTITYHGATDVGNVRTNNEDVFHVSPAERYCMVADGMGGAAAGEVASRIFADTCQAAFAGHDGLSEADTIARIQTAFQLANLRILEHVKRHPGHHGMGCTAELLAFAQERFIIGHVGDSRVYRLKGQALTQLTKDHSLVQEQMDRGLISPAEALHHPRRNVILRAVGINRTLGVDIVKGRISPGDLLLLCSDGLTDMVVDDALNSVLTMKGTLHDKSDALIRLAKRAGGKDNVTVVLAVVS